MSNSNNKQQGSGGGSAPAGAAAAAPAAGAPPAAATGSAPVATPSTGSLASSPASWCVGCQITLSTTLGEVVKGELFAYDGKSNCLVLREPATGEKENTTPNSTSEGHNIRIINANYIKKVLSAEQPSPTSTLAKEQNNPLPYVCMKRAEQREAKALQDAKKRAEQIGVGVTREAQKVFDGVNKTLPCKWKDKDIVVLGEVTIVSPYGIDNCTVVKGAEATLEHVKKVLNSLK